MLPSGEGVGMVMIRQEFTHAHIFTRRQSIERKVNLGVRPGQIVIVIMPHQHTEERGNAMGV